MALSPLEMPDIFKDFQFEDFFRTFDINLFAYQGFDPTHCAQFMMERMGGDFTEILKLIELGLTRGNNIDGICRSSSQEITTWLRRMEKKYQLTSKAKDESWEVITLSRICIAFPIETCNILEQISDEQMLVSSVVLGDDYPRVMRHMTFASLLVDASVCADWELIVQAHCFYQFHFTRRISPHAKKDTNANVKKKVESYATVGMNGSSLSMEKRVELLIKYNILDSQNNVKANVRVNAEKFRDL